MYLRGVVVVGYRWIAFTGTEVWELISKGPTVKHAEWTEIVFLHYPTIPVLVSELYIFILRRQRLITAFCDARVFPFNSPA